MAKNKNYTGLWDGVEENDFYTEKNIEDVELAEYDLKEMTIFIANVNYFRQIIRLSDSLKPVERRILWTMYKDGNRPNKKQKSAKVESNAMAIHNHGSCYPSIVLMTQRWKKPVPLIVGEGSFGTESSEIYAANRYTSVSMSKYAYECFFSDYDEDCIEMMLNSASDTLEPMSLPAKFPNILVNGGFGFTSGNAFCIPPFNIDDIITMCKKIIKDPDEPDIFMIPDIPTGCTVVDDGENLQSICNYGKGLLKLRSVINVIDKGKTWELQVTNLPWFVSLESVNDRLVELAKANILPIKDIKNQSYPIQYNDGSTGSVVDYRIVLDKVHDPYATISKLYKLTLLQKSYGVNFKVVLEQLEIGKLNLRDLIQSWLDERRSYLRRLYNKRIAKMSSRIDLLNVMIKLYEKNNIEKVVKIIKNNNSSDIVDKLMKLEDMNSFQATKIGEMRLSAFSKDMKDKYISERKELKEKLDELMDTVRSEKKIDRVIERDLEDLRKYGTPRKSEVLSESKGTVISDTDHIIILTRQNMIKKLLLHHDISKDTNLGAFKQGDAPIIRLEINNKDKLMFVDDQGKYSVIPVHEIDTTELNHTGLISFDVTGLNGNIISVSHHYDEEYVNYITDKLGTPYVVSITKMGYIKKTPLSEFTSLKSNTNVRYMRLRENDSVIDQSIIFEHSNLIIYTKGGNYVTLNIDDMNEMTRTSMGIIGMKLADGDECIGFNVIGKKDKYIVVVTNKGCVKKTELKYFEKVMKKTGSYLTTVDKKNDYLIYASGMRDKQKLVVFTKTDCKEVRWDDIPTLTRKAKCRKLIPLVQGNSIVSCDVRKMNKDEL